MVRGGPSVKRCRLTFYNVRTFLKFRLVEEFAIPTFAVRDDFSENWLVRAGQLLYEAKRWGRDRETGSLPSVTTAAAC